MNEYIFFQENPLSRELHVELDGKYVIFESTGVDDGYIVVGHTQPVKGDLPSYIFKRTVTGSSKIVVCPPDVQKKVEEIYRKKASFAKLLK